MNHPTSKLERQLVRLSPGGAPSGLREVVLKDIRQELAASRWDRYLGRAAVLLLSLGAAIHAATGFGLASDPYALRKPPSQISIVHMAATVARATDFETGQYVARQLAVWRGHPITREQLANLDAALEAELQKQS